MTATLDSMMRLSNGEATRPSAVHKEQLGIFDWLKRGAEKYGKDYRDWRFVCPGCGNVQSIFLVKGRNPFLTLEEIESWIERECESRHALVSRCDQLASHVCPGIEIRITREDIENPLCGFEYPGVRHAFPFKD